MNLIIAVADLMEAEGRTLRRHTARLGWGLALIVLSCLLAAVGFGFWIWGLFQFAAQAFGDAAAALLTGTVAVVLAGGVAWLIRRLTR